MSNSAISQVYWRKVKSGERTYESIPASKTGEVLELAKTEVVTGVINKDDFYRLTGITFAE